MVSVFHQQNDLPSLRNNAYVVDRITCGSIRLKFWIFKWGVIEVGIMYVLIIFPFSCVSFRKLRDIFQQYARSSFMNRWVFFSIVTFVTKIQATRGTNQNRNIFMFAWKKSYIGMCRGIAYGVWSTRSLNRVAFLPLLTLFSQCDS